MPKQYSTEEVILRISQSKNSQQAEAELSGELTKPTLNSCLYPWIDDLDMQLPQLFQRARIYRSLGYKIISGKRNAGRDMLIVIALVLQMDLKGAQHLLTVGGRNMLYPRNRRDMRIIYGITHGETPEAVHEALVNMKEAGLWSDE